MIVMTII